MDGHFWRMVICLDVFFGGEDWENPLQNIFITIYRGYEFTIWKFKINHHELN